MVLTKEQVLEQCKQAVAASNANGLQVLALIAGVIRQVAPSSVEPAVAFPETLPSVALPEKEPSVESPQAVAVPETSSVAPVAESLPETASSAPSSPTYRLVLNVPEIGLKGFAD